MIRYMFTNNSDQEWTIEVKSNERVILYELQADTPQTKPQAEIPPAEKGRWSFVLPAGMIRGFVADEKLDYTNPNPRDIDVILKSNKDPWPPPPPPPPGYREVLDFKERYPNFILSLGALVPSQRMKVRVKPLDD